MRKPRRGKTRENKFNQVQKGSLDVAEREVEGLQVLAYFGTDVDRGESAIGVCYAPSSLGPIFLLFYIFLSVFLTIMYL